MLHLQLVASEGMRSAPPAGERHAHRDHDDGRAGILTHEVVVDVSAPESDGREVVAEGHSVVDLRVLHLDVEQATVRALTQAGRGLDELRFGRFERGEGVERDVEVCLLNTRLLSEQELIDAQPVGRLESVGGRVLLL